MKTITTTQRRAINRRLRENVEQAVFYDARKRPFVRVRVTQAVKGRVTTLRKGRVMLARKEATGWTLVPIPTPHHMCLVMIGVPRSHFQKI